MTEGTEFPYKIGELLSCKPGHSPHDHRLRYRVDKIFPDAGLRLTYRHSNDGREQVSIRPFMLIYGLSAQAFSISGVEDYRWRNFHQSFVTEIIIDSGETFDDFIHWINNHAPEFLTLAMATKRPDPPLFQIEIKIS